MLSTPGTGTFNAWIDKSGQEISYRLSLEDLVGDVQQAHIHLGGRHQSGGIAVFLCTNLGNSPQPAHPCPPSPATITGTFGPTDVIGPAGQGIDPGEFGELVDAVRAGVTYANLHSTKYPGGEIRAQLDKRHPWRNTD